MEKKGMKKKGWGRKKERWGSGDANQAKVLFVKSERDVSQAQRDGVASARWVERCLALVDVDARRTETTDGGVGVATTQQSVVNQPQCVALHLPVSASVINNSFYQSSLQPCLIPRQVDFYKSTVVFSHELWARRFCVYEMVRISVLLAPTWIHIFFLQFFAMIMFSCAL